MLCLEVVIGSKMIESKYFHSHLETLQMFTAVNIKDQVIL